MFSKLLITNNFIIQIKSNKNNFNILILSLVYFSTINSFLYSQLTLSYMIPDIGSPGMSTYIEFVGVYNFTNSLGGGDGLIKSNILKIKTVNASDTNRVIFSPGIISWNGRLISTQAFVKEGASEGPVPIFIENGLATSMVDTFFIVNPQNIKPLTDGGIIGEGSLGYRSKEEQW